MYGLEYAFTSSITGALLDSFFEQSAGSCEMVWNFWIATLVK